LSLLIASVAAETAVGAEPRATAQLGSGSQPSVETAVGPYPGAQAAVSAEAGATAQFGSAAQLEAAADA
jgi:hypothetical protein